MWVEFVVGSLYCFERFFSRYPGFPLSSRSNTSKFQFDWSGTHGHVSTSCHELLSAPWVPNYNYNLLVAGQSIFRAPSGLVPSLSLRIWLWRYLPPILVGELASPCAIPLKPLALFLFRAQLASRWWGSVGSTIGKEYEKDTKFFSAVMMDFRWLDNVKSSNSPGRVYQVFVRGLNFLTSQCNFLIVYRLRSHICSNTCSRTKKRPKRPPS